MKLRSPLLSSLLQARPARGAVAALLLASLFAAAPGPVQAANPQASKLYEDALARFERKDTAGAILQLKNALQLDAAMLPVHVLLGRALLANGEVVAAEVAFGEALRLGVERGEVVVPLARTMVAQGKQKGLLADPRLSPVGLRPGPRQQMLLVMAGAAADIADRPAALRWLEEARSVDPTNVDVFLAEVPIRIRFRQFQEALAAADRALALAPGLVEALYLKGSIYQGSGNVTMALPLYDQALQRNPKHLEALISRAGAALDLNRQADLDRDVAAIEAIAPKDPRGAYLKAMAADRAGRTDAARDAFRVVTGLLDAAPPEFLQFRPQLLMINGLAHHALGEFEKAKPYLEILQLQQPTSPAAKLLGQIYLRDNNLTQAAAVLEAYLRGSPNDNQAVTIYAAVSMALGQYGRATQLTQQALGRQQENPALRTVLGASLVGSGRVAEGATELEAVVKKDPGNIGAASTLAMLNLGAGRNAAAIQIAANLQKRYPNNPAAWNLLGTAKAAAGDATGARQAYESALAQSAAFAPAIVGLARLEVAAGTLDPAARRLAALLTTEPKNVDANLEMGLLLERRAQLAEAQRFLEKADEVSGPSNFNAALALVDFHLRNGQLDAARKALDRAQSRSPDALAVLLAQARLQHAARENTLAKSTLARASSAALRDPAAQVRIALLQLQVDTPAAAAYSIEKALATNPRWLPALALMTDIELRQNEPDKAEARAKSIVASHPRAAVGYALLGDVALARNQAPLAITHYRKAHELERSPASAVRLYATAKGVDEVAAARFAQEWVKANPEDVALRRILATDLARTGKYAEAKVHYEAIVQQAPKDSLALNDFANVLIELGSPAALPMAEKALALNPNAPFIIGTAGWAAFKQGQLDRALQLLRDARLRDPDNLDTRYFLASALAKSGRKAEARTELESALTAGRPFQHTALAQELAATLR